MSITITPMQQRVLDMINEHVSKHDKSPTLKEIMKALDYGQLSSVQRHVDALRSKGVLPDTKAWSRGVQTHRTATKNIPLLGTVECGTLSLAEENLEAYIPFPITKLRNQQAKYFFVRAHGDSMNQSKFHISENDYLLVRQQQAANRGDIIIALYGDDATCKLYDLTNDGIPKLVPQSSNPVHRPKVMLDGFSVLGVVEDVVRPERRAYV